LVPTEAGGSPDGRRMTICAIRVDDPNRHACITWCEVRDQFSIWRPARASLCFSCVSSPRKRVIAELARGTAVDAKDPQRHGAATIGHEDRLFAIRRPVGKAIARRIIGEVSMRSALPIEEPNVVVSRASRRV